MARPMGSPEPRPLASVMMSGATPECCQANIFPGAPDARLHFIEDQQNAVPVAQLPQARQESRPAARYSRPRPGSARPGSPRPHSPGRCSRTACLDVVEHRPALVVAGEQWPVGVGIRHVRDARHGRKEARLLGVFARGEGERAHRAAVKPAEKADVARAPGRVARKLQGRLRPLPCRFGEERPAGSLTGSSSLILSRKLVMRSCQ